MVEQIVFHSQFLGDVWLRNALRHRFERRQSFLFVPCSSSPDGLATEKGDARASSSAVSPVALYKLLVPLLRCETIDMRNTVVNALSLINYAAVRWAVQSWTPSQCSDRVLLLTLWNSIIISFNSMMFFDIVFFTRKQFQLRLIGYNE